MFSAHVGALSRLAIPLTCSPRRAFSTAADLFAVNEPTEVFCLAKVLWNTLLVGAFTHERCPARKAYESETGGKPPHSTTSVARTDHSSQRSLGKILESFTVSSPGGSEISQRIQGDDECLFSYLPSLYIRWAYFDEYLRLILRSKTASGNSSLTEFRFKQPADRRFN